MHIMVTGGAGYIGSHTCLELLQAGHSVTVVDNLLNSSEESLRRVQQLTGKKLTFHKIDLLDQAGLEGVFQKNQIDAVIHFAGLKAVGESLAMPLRYYHNNLVGTLHLCELMLQYRVNRVVFSSSATVYGDPASVPITEDFPLAPANPYGRTKLMIEEILRDMQAADTKLSVVILRYFNPVGAHASGLIGEDPRGIPNNIMPYIAQVAVGQLPKLYIFGDDYPTIDGTGVRDYIHVADLAAGHLHALEKAAASPGLKIYNLGTGQGVSVLELVRAFEAASGRSIPYEITARRPGDSATSYNDPAKAETELGWKATRNLQTMCRDSWRWQENNPQGYGV